MLITHIEADDLYSYRKSMSTGPLDRITAIIGKNNSGKSNILKMLNWLHTEPQVLLSSEPSFPEVAKHQYPGDAIAPGPRLKVVFSLSDREIASIADPVANTTVRGYVLNHLRTGIIIERNAKWDEPTQSVNRFRFGSGMSLDKLLIDAPTHISVLPQHETYLGGVDRAVVKLFMDFLKDSVVYLSGWRNPSDVRSGGSPIVKILHLWRDPPKVNRHLRKKFDAIQALFFRLAALDNAELAAEATGSELQIKWGGRTLSLADYGDGFQHLLMIAYELVVKPGSLFLLEEIETHLHPEAQRRLLDVMQEHKECQFLLTTHSPVLLDGRAAGLVLRVEHNGEESQLTRCIATKDHFKTLDQLDARASDILQANVVIWVEGPSDRILLLRWFELSGFGLVEERHFHFAFYGGSVRSHLSVGDNEDALVDVLKLGRHVVMIADSDKNAADAKINSTKQRLAAETVRAGGISWITAGREIENYLTPSSISRTLHRIAAVEAAPAFGQFDRLSESLLAITQHLSNDAPSWLRDYGSRKVAGLTELARDLTREDLHRFDLSEKCLEVLNYISKHNGLGGRALVGVTSWG